MVVRHQDVRWTYAEFGARVDRVARALVGAGLRPGDRMGIWAPNCAEWLLVQYASAKAGVILVNVNPAYRTSELEFVLNQSGCRVLISARAFKSSDYVAMVRRLLHDVPRSSARCSWIQVIGRSCWRRATLSYRCRRGFSSTIPSTSSTRAARPASRRERRSLITTSSTTASSSARHAVTHRRTGSASRCRSTTASGWCSAISPARRTRRAWSIPAPSFEPRATLDAVQE